MFIKISKPVVIDYKSYNAKQFAIRLIELGMPLFMVQHEVEKTYNVLISLDEINN